MSDFVSLNLAKIHVGKDRSRDVDDDHALAIKASMVEHFQFQPIIVRKTPNGKAPYTLVDGAHRCRAIELLDDKDAELNCLIVKADNAEAAMVEVAANVFRNELTALDRAIAVQIYRDQWEKKYGKVNPKGGRPKNTANLAELIAEEAAKGFGASCAERLGLSKRAIERSSQIAANLPPDLVSILRGTAAADNQSQLEAFAKLPPKQRAKAAGVVKDADGDIAKALAALTNKQPDNRTAQQKLSDTVVTAFGRLKKTEQKKLIKQLTELMEGSGK